MEAGAQTSAAGPAPGPAASPPPSRSTSWGDLRPRRLCRWEEKDGRVALLRPRFGRGWLGRRLQAVFNPRPYRVLLDEVGSFIWLRCDGEARVESIAAAMKERFGGKVEPVEDRLVSFLQSLLRGRFVEMGPGGPGAQAR